MKLNESNATRGVVMDAQGEVVDGGWLIKGKEEGSFLPEDSSLIQEILERGCSIQVRDDESTLQIRNLRESGLGKDHVDFDLL
jgi:hypothetical protein